MKLCVLIALVLVQFITNALGATMPPNAVKYTPLLISEKTKYWKEMKLVSIMGAQIEQETCISLKSPTCWSNDAQLKTSREQGVGFSQLTRAYTANGAVRFDSLGALVNKYPKDLAGFSWSNWKDPQLGMRAYVLMIRDTCKAIKGAKDQLNQISFCLSAYNGGQGGLSNDILSCKAVKGCDPTVWLGNVALHSLKSKTAIKGYGQSAYDINRGYVTNVTVVRRVRYLSLDV